MLNHPEHGLKRTCLEEREQVLLSSFQTLLDNYKDTTREQWAVLKESCLLLLGSHIASCIDHLISGLRTPAIAESAIRSAGIVLIAANEAKAKNASQTFMRNLLNQAIQKQ